MLRPERPELILCKGPRFLAYDLQILCDYVREHSLSRVVLLLQDSESFEGSLLAELVEVLR